MKENFQHILKAKIGKGCFAICYLNEDNEAVKIYHEEVLFSPLIGIKNDTYVFPPKIYYNNNGRISSTVMPFVKGLPIIKEDIELNKVIFGINKVYEDTDKLSDINIVIEDINNKNILYDRENKRLRIVDTDNYCINNGYYDGILKQRNIAILNYSFCYSVISSIEEYISFLEKNKVLKELDNEMKNFTFSNKLLKEYLIALRTILEEKVNKEIITFQDVRMTIKKLERK